MDIKKHHQVILLVIIVLNILLRIPGLYDPVSYGDECIYLTLGQALNKGLVFYRDIHDNKPPLLYFVAALAGGSQFYFRFIMIGWNSLNVYLIYLLLEKVLKSKPAGLLGALAFAYFSLLPEGRVANGEIFMILPATLGVFFAFLAMEKKKQIWWLATGFLFSLAFLFKIPIGFDFAGFLIGLFIFFEFNKQVKIRKIQKIKALLLILKDKRLYLVLAGFISPIILSVIYYSLKGAFTPYVRSALMQNIGYLSSWGGDNSGLIIRAVILLAITVMLFVLRKSLGFKFTLFSLIGFWGLYGVYLSERPYPHYYLEIVPWGVAMFVILAFQKKKQQLLVFLLFLSLLRIGYKIYDFWWYPNLSYYQKFASLVTGKIDTNEYFKYFGDKVSSDYQIAHFLKTKTSSEDRVFIWGDGVCIYSLSRRLPPGRYTATYHIFDFDGFNETAMAIEAKQPKIIIKLASEKRNFPKLNAILATNYVKILNLGEAEIYRQVKPM